MYSTGIGVKQRYTLTLCLWTENLHCIGAAVHIIIFSLPSSPFPSPSFLPSSGQAVVNYVFAVLGGHQFAQMAMVTGDLE